MQYVAMRFRTKRKLAFASVASYLFLTGLENAIILPTAWQYLRYLGSTEDYLLGVIISGFSASAAVAGIIGGRLADSYPTKTKHIVIAAVCAVISGNAIYLIGRSVVYIILGRLLCGLGSSAGAALLAEVCRVTSPRERTSVLAVCSGLRQVGFLIGPGFQVVLEYFNFKLFNGLLEVCPFNAPGLFMAVLWIVFLLFVLVFYQNLDVEHKYEMLRKEPSTQLISGYSFELTDSQEDVPLINEIRPNSSFRRWYFIEESLDKPSHYQPVTLSVYIDEFLHDDTVVLFGMTMVLFFGQVLVETIIPPLMSKLFDYTSFETSMLYMIGGSISISVYTLVAVTTRWTTDSYLLMFGWIMHILGFIFLVICLPTIESGEVSKQPVLLAGFMLLYVGFPVACVGATSLLTKCVSLRVQGVAQGLRRFGTFCGLILGPLWGGATLKQPVLQMSIPLVLLVLLGTMFFSSFKKIKSEEQRSWNDYSR